MKRKILIFVLAFVLFSPFYIVSAKLTPDCGQVVDGKIANVCDFDDLMTMVNKVIDFMLFTLATPLVALIVAYAGFTMIANSTNVEKAGKAKKMLTNAVVGYVIALAAWLIINTILKALGYEGPTLLS